MNGSVTQEVEVNGKKLSRPGSGRTMRTHASNIRRQRISRWVGGEIVQAMAYDNPIPGFESCMHSAHVFTKRRLLH